MSSKVIANKSK